MASGARDSLAFRRVFFHGKGDRVRIVMSGKFLPYKTY